MRSSIPDAYTSLAKLTITRKVVLEKSAPNGRSRLGKRLPMRNTSHVGVCRISCLASMLQTFCQTAKSALTYSHVGVRWLVYAFLYPRPPSMARHIPGHTSRHIPGCEYVNIEVSQRKSDSNLTGANFEWFNKLVSESTCLAFYFCRLRHIKQSLQSKGFALFLRSEQHRRNDFCTNLIYVACHAREYRIDMQPSGKPAGRAQFLKRWYPRCWYEGIYGFPRLFMMIDVSLVYL